MAVHDGETSNHRQDAGDIDQSAILEKLTGHFLQSLGIRQQIFGDPAEITRQANPVIGDFVSTVTFAENVVNAAPQLLGPLVEALLAAGALDAYLTPVQMKKGRPGILVTVLAPPSRREAIEELLFRETTTLGVRRQEWDRTVLERETTTVETAYGPIRVKIGLRGGTVYNAWPEFDDCQRAAKQKKVAVKQVLAEALAAWRSGGGKQQ